jgi:hypothetical protein
MKNRLERRKAKRLAAEEVTNVSFMMHGNRFFWFKTPEGIPPHGYRLDASAIRETASGFTMKVAGHTVELRGPFESEAECQKDSDRVIGGDLPVKDGGILDQATLDLIRKRTPGDEVH